MTADPPSILLQTKLQPPRPPAGLVHRRRLMTLLDRGLERKLTLITAPAGSGKTTSLAAWVQQCDRRVCWLSLDGDEDEITRFFRYLIASLQTAWPDMGREALKSLRAAQAPNPRTALISLLNDAAQVQADFALVLDDFHTLKSQEIHVAVAFLVDRAPPQMHFFIGSRAAPPLPLGRLRAANQLVEITPKLLSFNLQETRTFLNDSMQLQLAPETISRLQNQTEGWVTGLQLAALAAQTETSTELEHERDEYLEAFSGEQRHIFDYLGAEVLDQQEPRLQAFLLRSAILQRMSAGLCAAVVGTGEMSGSASRRSSQSMLEQLEAGSLFTSALDERRRWYRYHPLFRDFLLARALEVFPDEIPALYQRAANWYAANGYSEEAIEYSLQGGQPDWTAAQIERRADTMWTHDEMWQLQGWIEALPAAARMKSPKLGLYHAWTQIMTGSLHAAEAGLQEVESAWEEGGAPTDELVGIAAVVRATLYVQSNRPGAIGLYERANKVLPLGAMNWRGGAQLGLGMAHLLGAGDLAAASRWLSSAVAINLEVGNHFAALYANYFLGQAQLAQGRLKAAEATYLEALELVSGSPDILAGLASWAQLGLGEIWRERNRFREASERLLEASRLGKVHDNKETVVKALIGLAKIEAAQGRWTEVEQLLEEAAISARKPGIPDLSGALEQARDWAAMRRGDPMAAQSWQPELEAALERGMQSWRVPPAILRARQLNAREQFAEAEQLARKLLAVLAPDQRAFRLEIEIIQALALRGLGQNTEALQALRPALAFGVSAGYRRMFLDEGEPMLMMLGGVEVEDRVARFARELLAEAEAGQDAPVPIGHALIEPLSNTELEMLALLSQGMTNLQIAEHRVVSINTVKWHLKNIYGKLGVSNRTAAVSKARSLGLL